VGTTELAKEEMLDTPDAAAELAAEIPLWADEAPVCTAEEAWLAAFELSALEGAGVAAGESVAAAPVLVASAPLLVASAPVLVASAPAVVWAAAPLSDVPSTPGHPLMHCW
jgi:hypothetical protein